MNTDLEKLAYEWIVATTDEVDTQSEYYCSTREVYRFKNLNKLSAK